MYAKGCAEAQINQKKSTFGTEFVNLSETDYNGLTN